jgi:hypothetical protein
MKKLFYLLGVAAVLMATGCKKEKDGGKSVSCNLPSTPVPSEMVGNWANGYNSSTQLVDTYNGQYLGNAWQSGKFFHFSEDGKYAEFYYMANSGLSSSTATRVIGTVTFDEAEGTFTFHGCKGHYRGWQNGQLTVDRDATQDEVENYLTQTYYYSFEETGGNLWMQIRFEPGGTPTSFRSVE